MGESSFPMIDQRAPRTNQAVVATIVVAAYWANWPWLVLVLAAILITGVVMGRDWVPVYWLYFGALQPRFGEGVIEDERMPRFAQGMGATGLVAGVACVYAGVPAIGWGLMLTLAAAAVFSTVTGICFGCLTYRMIAKLRGAASVAPKRIDLAAVGLPKTSDAPKALVEFAHPSCSECHVWSKRLREGDTPYAIVDVRENPALARDLGVALVPTVFEVAADGRVLRQLAP